MHSADKRFWGMAMMMALLTIACSPQLRRPSPVEEGWRAMQPIRAKMVLLVPDELDAYVYSGQHNGTEVRIPIGERATDLMDELLLSAFTSSFLMPVASEAEARQMISREDPELRRYDFVALPRFVGVTSWDGGHEFGFNVDVMLEISSFDTGLVEKIGGHGESATPRRMRALPRESAYLALEYAIDAVKDGIEMKRAAFSR
jgi:hypothetical protein